MFARGCLTIQWSDLPVSLVKQSPASTPPTSTYVVGFAMRHEANVDPIGSPHHPHLDLVDGTHKDQDFSNSDCNEARAF